MFFISQLEFENLSSKSEEEIIIKTQLNTYQKERARGKGSFFLQIEEVVSNINSQTQY